MNVLSVHQFNPGMMEEIFGRAVEFGDLMAEREGRREAAGMFIGESLINLFYQPSTRTRVSFGMAARNLGMKVDGTENAKEFSSAAKGETLEDTIRNLNEYEPAIIVLRHHETGAADRAAAVSDATIINAGDGMGEHPTQALLDLFTIQKTKGKLDGLEVVIGGDIRGRAARSLAQLLALYPNNRINFVSLPDFQAGEDIKKFLTGHDTEFRETADMYDALKTADVVYWTRLQAEYDKNKPIEEVAPTKGFIIDEAALEVLPSDAIIMHPLPRVGEIATSVDNDPRAVYFRQAGNGLYLRMALIDTIMQSANS